MPDDGGFDALSAAAELEAALAGASLAEDEIARARERLERDAGLEVERRTQAVLRDLLEVLDDVDRALEAARAAGDALLLGLELVQRRFLAVLAKHGVTPIAALGEPFDPAVHEAVSVLPAAGPEQAGRVVAVTRAGYRVGDTLLRPAGVVVAAR
jgi:molecular chaperone GrpE